MMDEPDHEQEPAAEDADEPGFKEALFEFIFRESTELIGGIIAVSVAAGLLWLLFG